MENQFGKTSRISICAAGRDGKTILEDVSFTAPYKIMTPFQKENGGIQVMPLCASAGIMKGDCQEFSYHVKEGADLEVLSQSFEKIHRMDGGYASRKIDVKVEKNAVIFYYPQPVIPFAGAAFDSDAQIYLEDDTSRLFLLEIISCGRTAHGERFAYRRFSSQVQIFRRKKLIYRDHTRYEPEKMPMEGIGMYEGYTHMANLFLSMSDRAENVPELEETIWNILNEECREEKQEKSGESFSEDRMNGNACDGGVTRTADGDLVVRIFGYRAQTLLQIAEKIKKLYEA